MDSIGISMNTKDSTKFERQSLNPFTEWTVLGRNTLWLIEISMNTKKYTTLVAWGKKKKKNGTAQGPQRTSFQIEPSEGIYQKDDATAVVKLVN